MGKLTILAALTAVAAQLTSAQMRGGMAGAQADPARLVEARVSMLAQALSLSDAQKQQAKKLFLDAQEAGRRYRDQIQVARQELQTAVKANDLAAIERSARDIGSATGEITAIDARAQAAFYALLTAEQKTKYDQMPGRGLGVGPGRRMRPPE